MKLLCLTVFSQKGGPQGEALFLLGNRSNSNFINRTTCSTHGTATTLNCSFLDTPQLITNQSTGEALGSVEFRICLCDSAMTVKYYLTNNETHNSSCQQCPTLLVIGGLSLYHGYNVSIDDGNVTNIAVLVSL